MEVLLARRLKDVEILIGFCCIFAFQRKPQATSGSDFSDLELSYFCKSHLGSLSWKAWNILKWCLKCHQKEWQTSWGDRGNRGKSRCYKNQSLAYRTTKLSPPKKTLLPPRPLLLGGRKIRPLKSARFHEVPTRNKLHPISTKGKNRVWRHLSILFTLENCHGRSWKEKISKPRSGTQFGRIPSKIFRGTMSTSGTATPLARPRERSLLAKPVTSTLGKSRWHFVTTVDGNQKSGKLTSWGKGSWNPIIYGPGFLHPRWCRISAINSLYWFI